MRRDHGGVAMAGRDAGHGNERRRVPDEARGPSTPDSRGLLRLQRSAGNRAVAAMAAAVQRESAPREPEEEEGERPVQTQRLPLASAHLEPGTQRQAPRDRTPAVIQRQNDFTITAMTVAGATPVVGAADTFVAPRGSTVTTTATVVSASGAVLPARAVRWSGGRAGADQLHRLVSGGAQRAVLRARVGASTRAVTVFIADAPALPAPVPAAALEHRNIGRSNPGTDFGLTVVTIGSQGVTGPSFVITPFLSGAQWRFGVRRIRHGFKVGVASQGRRDVPNAAAVPANRAGAIITDLTPPAAGAIGPPRARFWVRRITVAHEQAHVDHFYLPAHGFWPPAMRAFEAAVQGVTVNFDPATARRSSQVITAQRPGWRTDIDTRHGAADAAEIPSSETFAHGVSNPMYTALIASIRATVRPPSPTGFRATPGPGSVTLNWTQDVTLATGLALERRIGNGPWVPIAPALAPATVTFTDGGLAAGSRVTYRLTAQGAAGPSRGVTVRARTP